MSRKKKIVKEFEQALLKGLDAKSFENFINKLNFKELLSILEYIRDLQNE